MSAFILIPILIGFLSGYGGDAVSLLSRGMDILNGFASMFSAFPPLFNQLVGFGVAGIVVGIIIRLL